MKYASSFLPPLSLYLLPLFFNSLSFFYIFSLFLIVFPFLSSYLLPFPPLTSFPPFSSALFPFFLLHLFQFPSFVYTFPLFPSSSPFINLSPSPSLPSLPFLPFFNLLPLSFYLLPVFNSLSSFSYPLPLFYHCSSLLSTHALSSLSPGSSFIILSSPIFNSFSSFLHFLLFHAPFHFLSTYLLPYFICLISFLSFPSLSIPFLLLYFPPISHSLPLFHQPISFPFLPFSSHTPFSSTLFSFFLHFCSLSLFSLSLIFLVSHHHIITFNSISLLPILLVLLLFTYPPLPSIYVLSFPYTSPSLIPPFPSLYHFLSLPCLSSAMSHCRSEALGNEKKGKLKKIDIEETTAKKQKIKRRKREREDKDKDEKGNAAIVERE